MESLEFATLPGVGGQFARAVAVGRRRPGPLPDRVARVADHRQDPDRLADYAQVCGFALRDAVPATWLHVQTFPLQAALMARADFPFGLAGLVHASNVMTLHRPVRATDRLELDVRASGVRPHRRGTLFDLHGEVRTGGVLAWSGVSTYLAVGVGPADGPAEMTDAAEPATELAAEAGEPTQQWRLPADLGRRYARVSGDVNPIHLWPLSARPFGFKRPIIHGMWTHARALAALGGRLPAAYAVSVRFTRPILLPARVGFAARSRGSQFALAVLDRSGRPALTGTLTAADA